MGHLYIDNATKGVIKAYKVQRKSNSLHFRCKDSRIGLEVLL